MGIDTRPRLRRGAPGPRDRDDPRQRRRPPALARSNGSPARWGACSLASGRRSATSCLPPSATATSRPRMPGCCTTPTRRCANARRSAGASGRTRTSRRSRATCTTTATTTPVPAVLRSPRHPLLGQCGVPRGRPAACATPRASTASQACWSPASSTSAGRPTWHGSSRSVGPLPSSCSSTTRATAPATARPRRDRRRDHPIRAQDDGSRLTVRRPGRRRSTGRPPLATARRARGRQHWSRGRWPRSRLRPCRRGLRATAAHAGALRRQCPAGWRRSDRSTEPSRGGLRKLGGSRPSRRAASASTRAAAVKRSVAPGSITTIVHGGWDIPGSGSVGP